MGQENRVAAGEKPREEAGISIAGKMVSDRSKNLSSIRGRNVAPGTSRLVELLVRR